MTVTTQTASFHNCDRYFFDFTLCSYSKGWMQIDCYHDAFYFGIWTRPLSLEIITFAEGDFTHTLCETPDEYRNEIVGIVAAYDSDDTPCRIDRYWLPATSQTIQLLSHCGLMSYLH